MKYLWDYKRELIWIKKCIYLIIFVIFIYIKKKDLTLIGRIKKGDIINKNWFKKKNLKAEVEADQMKIITKNITKITSIKIRENLIVMKE